MDISLLVLLPKLSPSFYLFLKSGFSHYNMGEKKKNYIHIFRAVIFTSQCVKNVPTKKMEHDCC